MVKVKDKDNSEAKEIIKKIDVGDIIPTWMSIYSREVNLDRAIIDGRDGLKPVQRRILYDAYKMRIFPTSKKVKVAKLTGDVLGNFHPHGDSSVNQAIVTLSQEWKMRIPLMDIPGNNGDIFGNSAAAARYIETKLTKASMYLIQDYQKAVNMIDNYDNTQKEPEFLPSAMPNALINPSLGIGYGVGCNILPHNPIELLNGAIELINNPKVTNEELLKIIKGPDLPTKGSLIGKHVGLEELQKGAEQFVIRGHFTTEKHGKKIDLIADEVPYGTNPNKIIEQCTNVAENNPALNIISVEDESRNNKLRLVVRLKDDSHLEDTEQLLWKSTDMEIKYKSNNTMVINGKPQQIGTRAYLNYWLGFRKEMLTRSLNYDLNVNQKRLNIVDGLIKVSQDTDNIVKLAKASSNKAGFVEDLIKYGFNKEQAENIASIALYRLGKQDTEQLLEAKKIVEEKIADINSKLNNLSNYLIQTLNEAIEDLRKDDTVHEERLTKLVTHVVRKKINLNKLAAEAKDGKPTYVAVMSNATALRMTPRVFNNNIEDAKEEKPIIKTLKGETTDYIMFLTDSGQVVTRFVNDLTEINPKYDVESFYKQISDLRADEKFINATLFNSKIKKEKPYILSISQMGLAKASEIESSMPNTNTKRYLNRLTQYNGLKNKGDRVGIATIVTPEDIKNKKIVITMKGEKTWSIDLDKVSIQAGKGSGARKVKPFEVHNIEKYEIVDK